MLTVDGDEDEVREGNAVNSTTSFEEENRTR